MNQLEEKLSALGLSSQESRVYLSLLRGGRMTGYQIAKDLGISRSGVYNVLQSLYRRGAAYLLPGETNVYEAADPEGFIGELEQRFSAAAGSLKNDLRSFKGAGDRELFFNIRGKGPMLEKVRGIIDGSKSEILINTDIPVAEFEPSLSAACARGVRVIMFSFFPQDLGELPIIFYQAPANPEPGHQVCAGDSRLMLTADMERCILGGLSRGEFAATFSANPLLTSVIAEHIHIDIYLLGLRRKQGIREIPEELMLQSLLEKENRL
jgi:sugar-specific transcriptional regulator TrmB